MGWPVNTMQYSAPTNASHALEAQQQQEEERGVKRRKKSQQHPSVQDDTMMEDDGSPPNVESTSSSSSSMTSQSDNNMEMDTITGNSASSSSSSNANANHSYYRPASFNNFNGNALSDEELVYQVLEGGCQTYAEVVQFCVAGGVPVSRILEMDLMGRLSFLKAK